MKKNSEMIKEIKNTKRTRKLRHLKNDGAIKITVLLATLGIVGGTIGTLVACNKNKVNERSEETTQSSIETTIENTTPETDLTVLDITNNDSVQAVAEQFYLDNEFACVNNSITVDDIIDMELVLNDYTIDKDGNVLVSSDRALDCCTYTNQLLHSDELINGICVAEQLHNNDINIDNLEYSVIPNVPDFTPLIDNHIDGSEFTEIRISEYTNKVNELINDINNYNDAVFNQGIDPTSIEPINRDSFNDYFLYSEEDLYPINRDFMNNNTVDGFNWLICTMGENTCELVGQVNPETLYLTNPQTGHDIRINRTSDELNDLNQFMSYQFSGMTPSTELSDRVFYTNTIMPETKYQETICSIEADMVNSINSVNGYSYTLSN